MDLRLNDHVVLITGGAKGIGAAITRASVREGAIPVVVDKDQPACEKLFADLKLARARGRYVIADLQRPDNCAKAVEETAHTFGRIDALVNNAGVNDGVGLEHGSPEKFIALAPTQSAALLQHDALCPASFETHARFHRQHQFQDRCHRTRKHIGLRCLEGRDPGDDARMGG